MYLYISYTVLINFPLLTASLRGVQISLGQLWTLGVKAQRIVNVCVDYSCPQTHRRGCASFGKFFLSYLQSKIAFGVRADCYTWTCILHMCVHVQIIYYISEITHMSV